jgi:hypothetical protein
VEIMSWFDSLPAVEAAVPCGTGTHTVRWEAGRLTLPAHPDTEAELVLGALGGDEPACITIAETWARHADDLTVLTAGPRCASDRVDVDWTQVAELRAQVPMSRAIPGKVPRALMYPSAGGGRGRPVASQPGPPFARPGRPGSPGHLGKPTLPLGAQTVPARPGLEEMFLRQQRQVELLQLLALGAEFQFRLAGTVTAAWAGPERAAARAGRRPELSGVLTGRFALAAQDWTGIDPDAVTVTPHEGPGWGTLELSGAGRGRRLRVSLPVGWLAEVWACGLAVVEGHLVVAIERPGFPRAGVLALAAPDSGPVALEPHATGRCDGGLMTWTLLPC